MKSIKIAGTFATLVVLSSAHGQENVVAEGLSEPVVANSPVPLGVICSGHDKQTLLYESSISQDPVSRVISSKWLPTFFYEKDKLRLQVATENGHLWVKAVDVFWFDGSDSSIAAAMDSSEERSLAVRAWRDDATQKIDGGGLLDAVCEGFK